jgi:hypothetical protein
MFSDTHIVSARPKTTCDNESLTYKDVEDFGSGLFESNISAGARIG